MYIEEMLVERLGAFGRPTKIEFAHPDREPEPRFNGGSRHSRLPNVNLLLGENGCGKTTLLQSVALAAFGPAASHVHPEMGNLIRANRPDRNGTSAAVRALFRLHRQDGAPGEQSESRLAIRNRGEVDELDSEVDGHAERWAQVYESRNEAFFAAAYGATRRVERDERFNLEARNRAHYPRAQRVRSVFDDSFSLVPLNCWLPALQTSDPDRFSEVVQVIDLLLRRQNLKFAEVRTGCCLFERGGMQIPFPGLGDGCQALLGWLGDLLRHICSIRPRGATLRDFRGIVLVDEIDLHLHPKWQRDVVETAARALPGLQFILTSQSPLVAEELGRGDVIRLQLDSRNRASVWHPGESIHGLDIA